MTVNLTKKLDRYDVRLTHTISGEVVNSFTWGVSHGDAVLRVEELVKGDSTQSAMWNGWTHEVLPLKA